MTKEQHDRFHSEEDRPPVFKNWKGWYTLVLSALVLYMLLLYAFTNLY